MDKLTIERQTLENIANAVRNKNYKSNLMSPSQITTAIDNLEVEDDYEWRKPDDWPDLESVELPHRDDINTLYFLYDKTCGVDEVEFYVTGSKHYVAKGAIVNGQFLEKERLSDTGHIYHYIDTLTERYTVYKLENNSAIIFDSKYGIGPSYQYYRQSCVWIYGELPKGSPGQQMTPFLRRFVLTRVKSNSHTFPNNYATGGGFDIPVSYHIGSGDVLDDWDGIALRRLGNGPVTPYIKQKSDYVVRNVTFNNQYDRGAITARNVILVNPHGVLFPGQYQYDQLIEKFVVIGGDLTCRSNTLQNCFNYAMNLRVCDLRDVDMNGFTRGTASFGNCYHLEELYLNSTFARPLDIQKSPLLKTECAIKILNELPEIDTTMRITFHRQVYLRIPSEIIDAAKSKGWDIRQSDYD